MKTNEDILRYMKVYEDIWRYKGDICEDIWRYMRTYADDEEDENDEEDEDDEDDEDINILEHYEKIYKTNTCK